MFPMVSRMCLAWSAVIVFTTAVLPAAQVEKAKEDNASKPSVAASEKPVVVAGDFNTFWGEYRNIFSEPIP